MRILLLLLAEFIGIGGNGQPGYSSTPAIALLSHTIATASGSTSVTSSAINTTGATLITIVQATSTSAGSTPTSSAACSNGWQGLTVYTVSTRAIQIFYCYAPTTSATETFTCTGSYPTCAIAAWSNTLTTSSVFDKQDGNNSAAGTSLQAGATGVTPSVSGELILAGMVGPGSFGWGGGTVSASSSFSVIGQTGAGAGEFGIDAYLVDSSTSLANTTFSWPTSQTDLASAIATFEP